MNKFDYLIIGGGVAGTTAAEFIRMHDQSGSILIVTEEPERLYSRVMLPHFLRDKIPFERLYVRTLEQYKERNIELLTNKRVSNINTQNKKIRLSDKEEIEYKKLLIASGGKVTKLPLPGSDLRGVTYLRTIGDVKEVKDLIGKSRLGVVIGGGFIGIEYAQSFIHAGLKTTAIIREPFFWSDMVGEEMGRLIGKILEKNGVKIISQVQADEFAGSGKLEKIKLDNGSEVAADIAGIGIGIYMELEHLKTSGIKINDGVVTNEYLETEAKDVWAAGDIAEFKDVIFNKHHQMGNWSNAAAQGKVVGPNMVAGWHNPKDGRERFETVSAYTISIFDNTFTFLGDPIVDEDTEVVLRGSIGEGSLGRLHLRGDVIAGAAFIGLNQDRRALEQLIKSKAKITVSRDKLRDVSFELGELSRK